MKIAPSLYYYKLISLVLSNIALFLYGSEDKHGFGFVKYKLRNIYKAKSEIVP